MENYVPRIAIPTAKKKTLHRLYNTGHVAIFYATNAVVAEGTPMKHDPAVTDRIVPCVAGDGAKCCGLSIQETYDDSTWRQLQNYHFANDTAQRLDGQPIGLLTSFGYALTLNYAGAVVRGNRMAIGVAGNAGKLVADADNAASSGNELPIIADTAGDGTDYIRIRYDFPFDIRPQ